MLVYCFTACVNAEDFAKKKARFIEMRYSIFCPMTGGTAVPDPSRPGSQTCQGKPSTKEECTAKGGRWGSWCLNQSKCVTLTADPVIQSQYMCQIDLPKEKVTPDVEEYLKTKFQDVQSQEEALAHIKKISGEFNEAEPAAASEPGPTGRRRRRRMRRSM